jgi:hypothetical protein
MVCFRSLASDEPNVPMEGVSEVWSSDCKVESFVVRHVVAIGAVRRCVKMCEEGTNTDPENDTIATRANAERTRRENM